MNATKGIPGISSYKIESVSKLPFFIFVMFRTLSGYPELIEKTGFPPN